MTLLGCRGCRASLYQPFTGFSLLLSSLMLLDLFCTVTTAFLHLQHSPITKSEKLPEGGWDLSSPTLAQNRVVFDSGLCCYRKWEETFLPQYIKLKFLLLQLAPASCLPFARHHREEYGSIFSPIPLDS